MAVLTEWYSPVQAQIVVEGGGFDPSTNQQKKLYMKGIFIQGGVKNHNHRVYPLREIRKAVDQVNDYLRQGDILGELDHPKELNINLDRVSHRITEMAVVGSDGVGKLQILSTPMGQLVRTLLEDGVKLGVSSRGSGNVNESTGEVSDFEIVTIDVVARPSAPDAYPRAVYEAFNHKRGKIIEDLANAVRHDPKAQHHLKKELLTWFNDLKA